MYTLFRRTDGGTHLIMKESENLDEIVEALKKRVRDGCPINRLHIYKNVEFELLCGVKFKEET